MVNRESLETAQRIGNAPADGGVIQLYRFFRPPIPTLDKAKSLEAHRALAAARQFRRATMKQADMENGEPPGFVAQASMDLAAD